MYPLAFSTFHSSCSWCGNMRCVQHIYRHLHQFRIVGDECPSFKITSPTNSKCFILQGALTCVLSPGESEKHSNSLRLQVMLRDLAILADSLCLMTRTSLASTSMSFCVIGDNRLVSAEYFHGLFLSCHSQIGHCGYIGC